MNRTALKMSLSMARSGALVDDGGAGLPPGAIAYADFKNGTYYYGGNSLSDFLYADGVWWGGTFDPSKIINGVGYQVANVNEGPSVAPALAAALTGAGGCTIVVDIVTGSDSAAFKFEFEENPGFSQELKAFFASADGLPVIGDYNDTTALAPLALNTAYRLAITLSATEIAVSVNGAAIVTYAVTDPFVCNYAAFQLTGLVWERVTLYPVKADAALPALSTP